jgi:ribosomal small subunit protein bTHX
MGKGDKKSKKGKRSKGSFGVSRSRNAIKSKMKRAAVKPEAAPVVSEPAPKPKRTVKKKTEA